MTNDFDALALKVAKTLYGSDHDYAIPSEITFARRLREEWLKGMEPVTLTKDTYALQIKEAWESGFRCGLREARQEETE